MKNNTKILLVEDNPYDAELTLRALRKNDITHAISHVEDGLEALDFIFARGKFSHRTTHPLPSLVLLDLKLPRVDGFEVLRELKSNSTTKSIPVVVLTSSNEMQDIQASYDLGANSYIVKPVQYNKFLEAVKHLQLYWMDLNQTQT